MRLTAPNTGPQNVPKGEAMKLLHLSDLHLGKRVNNYSMLEDQEYILAEILQMVDEEQPDGVILAGDIYDRPVPPTEAVNLFDTFLVQLAQRKVQVYIISGNHDSAERIAFGGRLMELSGVHVSPAYTGVVEPVVWEDAYGPVALWLLPFLKPAHVRHAFPEEQVESYTDAMRVAIAKMNPDFSRRNVLVTHQFITGAAKSDSEEISVGGADNVDASVLEGFDYVALGHIHGPQNIDGNPRIRYCGTPLKYSISEQDHKKSVTVVELGEKGNLIIRELPLHPKRDMKEIRGSYEELMRMDAYKGTSLQEDYLQIVLTDEDDIPNAMARLRTAYHNLMTLKYDNKRTASAARFEGSVEVKDKSPLELFEELFRLQNGCDLSEPQRSYLCDIIETLWEEKR